MGEQQALFYCGVGGVGFAVQGIGNEVPGVLRKVDWVGLMGDDSWVAMKVADALLGSKCDWCKCGWRISSLTD